MREHQDITLDTLTLKLLFFIFLKVLFLLLSYFLLGAESRALRQEKIATDRKYSGASVENVYKLGKNSGYPRNIRSSFQASDLGSHHVAPRGEDPPTSEPEPSKKAEPEPTGVAENWPEPGPDWETAFRTWGKAWHLHVYSFATVFLLMAFYAAYFVVHNARDGLQKKYLGICLNVVMFMFGSTRAFVLFFDPYHQGDLIGSWKTMHVLWSLGGPCLTSSDSLVILALVETTKISLAPPKLQKFRFIISVILGHFCLVLLTDFLVSHFVDAKPMLVFCQSFFISWGSLLGFAYLVIAFKLDRKLFAHKTKDKNKKLYIRMIYASGVANFFLAGIFIYSSAGVFGVYSRVTHVDSWSWWTLQTCLRASEVVSCALVFSVSAKRKTVKSALKKAERYEGNHFTSEGGEIMIAAGENDSQNVEMEVIDGGHEFHEASSARNQGRKMSIFSALLQSAKAKRGGQVTPSPISEMESQWNDIESRHNTLSEEDSEEHTMFTDLQKAKEDAFYFLKRQPSTH